MLEIGVRIPVGSNQTLKLVFAASPHIVLCFCFVFLRLVYPMLPVSLDCSFLIAPFVFSNVYLPELLTSKIDPP
jgi:hypothetical protein